MPLSPSLPGRPTASPKEKERRAGRKKYGDPFSWFEGERDDLGDADLRPVRQRLLHPFLQTLAIQPGPIDALVDDAKPPGCRIAPQAQMLARHFVIGIKGEIHGQIVSATP